jgi:hypothetical protein
MLEHLGQLDCSPDVVLNVKVPEGFEFYALYPEQYCASAVRWAAEHRFVQARRAVVVGIRSIGTTLSVLVTAALDANDWQAHRFTIRPSGDAFRRQAVVAGADRGDAERGLIVDEGPGLSGSSMAAVARSARGGWVAARPRGLFSRPRSGTRALGNTVSATIVGVHSPRLHSGHPTSVEQSLVAGFSPGKNRRDLP